MTRTERLRDAAANARGQCQCRQPRNTVRMYTFLPGTYVGELQRFVHDDIDPATFVASRDLLAKDVS